MAVQIKYDNDFLEISTALESNRISFEERGNFVYIYMGNQVVAFPKREWREVATAMFNFAKE